MFTVSREASVEYAHRLLHYAGKCNNLHGHSGKMMVFMKSDVLDSQGMVMDFADLKQVMNEVVIDILDHAVVLQQGDPLIEVLKLQGQRVIELSTEPTAENLARWIFNNLEQRYPNMVSLVTFYETANNAASYSATASK